MSYLHEGQLTTDTFNRKYVHMYTILYPVLAGIKILNYFIIRFFNYLIIYLFTYLTN